MRQCALDAHPEHGGASLLALTFALLLIGVSALGAFGIGQISARRAEVRKIEALGLVAMERAGGQGALACAIATQDLAITCQFGGGEILLQGAKTPPIGVGWRGSPGNFE